MYNHHEVFIPNDFIFTEIAFSLSAWAACGRFITSGAVVVMLLIGFPLLA